MTLGIESAGLWAKAAVAAESTTMLIINSEYIFFISRNDRQIGKQKNKV
jgi:hypothetical protein